MTPRTTTPTGADARTAETSLTLSRGLRVLEVLAGSPTGRTLTELSVEVGLSRPTLYRLVATLADHGLVRRSPDGAVAVGLGVLTLARHVLPALGEASGEVLQRLAESTEASAHLAVADGEETVAVAVAEPRRSSYHLGYRVGTRLPLGRGALGRAMVAGQEGRFEVLSSAGEVIPGATGMAVPVLGLGWPAAVGIVALRPLDAGVVHPLLRGAALELGAALNHGDLDAAPSPAAGPQRS